MAVLEAIRLAFPHARVFFRSAFIGVYPRPYCFTWVFPRMAGSQNHKEDKEYMAADKRR